MSEDLIFDTHRSITIQKVEIAKRLRTRSGKRSVKLPEYIEFSITGEVLKVFINDSTKNMQDNAVAFEGWILALKSWLPEIISKVVLDFEMKEDFLFQTCETEACHYNRFLYRLYNMLRLYPEWFFVNESKKKHIDLFVDWLKSNTFVFTNPSKERNSTYNKNGIIKKENQIESWFVFEEGNDLLTREWNIDSDKLFKQLPTGLFIEKVNNKNAVFPHRKSAIDLWGVDKECESLHIIELKSGANKGLGVIGELFFYTFLLYDTFFANKKLFEFKANKSNESIVLEKGKNSFKHLVSHILAEENHVLFADVVTKTITDGLKSLNIEFTKHIYSYPKMEIIDEYNNLSRHP